MKHGRFELQPSAEANRGTQETPSLIRLQFPTAKRCSWQTFRHLYQYIKRIGINVSFSERSALSASWLRKRSLHVCVVVQALRCRTNFSRQFLCTLLPDFARVIKQKKWIFEFKIDLIKQSKCKMSSTYESHGLSQLCSANPSFASITADNWWMGSLLVSALHVND